MYMYVYPVHVNVKMYVYMYMCVELNLQENIYTNKAFVKSKRDNIKNVEMSTSCTTCKHDTLCANQYHDVSVFV